MQFFYFDLGNVLVHFSSERGFRQLAELLGVPLSAVEQLMTSDGLQNAYESGQIDSETFCQRIRDAFGCGGETDDILLAISDIFWPASEVLELVKKLHSSQIPLGILSNTSPAHWEFLVTGMLEPYLRCFREIVLSFEVGSMKPHASIYDVAVARAGVAPAEIFFTDDRADNVAGALDFGIDAERYLDSETLRSHLQRRGVTGLEFD